MRPLLIRVLTILAIAAAPATATPGDESRTRDNAYNLAHAEVMQLLRTGDVRAITGYASNGWWLTIERLENGQPAWQYVVRVAAWGNTVRDVARDLRGLNLEAWRDGVLTFRAHYQGRDWLRCSIDTRPSSWGAVCGGNPSGGSGGGPAPGPYEPSMTD